MVALGPKTVDTQLIQLLERKRLNGELDAVGQKLLTTLQAEYQTQIHQLEEARDEVKELNIVSKQIEIEKAEAASEAFKESASGMTLKSAAYTPGYVNIEHMPQINTALADYNTLLRNNPVLVTDPNQADKLPLSRRELFTIGRKTKEVETENKGEEVKKLEEVTGEYECALREKHGKDFKCEEATEEQLKEVKTKSGRDIIDFMGVSKEGRAKLPPQVEKVNGAAQSQGTGISTP